MIRILLGDALEQLRVLPDQSVQTCVTSPPYWTVLDYGVPEQLGLEPTLGEHLHALSEVLGEVRRVLRVDGTLWLNYGDGYNTCAGTPGPGAGRAWQRKRRRVPRLSTGFGLKTRHVKRKELMGLPWRLAFHLSAEGWYLRSEVIWRKSNPAPEANTLDRPTRGHETVFLFARSPRYFFSGPVRGSVWSIAAESVPWHPAPFPVELARRCILASSRAGDTVLDPFSGSGSVGVAAARESRDFVGIELNPEYAALARRRIHEDMPLFNKAD